MRDWAAVTKEAKAVKEQVATVLQLMEHRRATYEAMGALRENMRIMQLLAAQLSEAETEQAEERMSVVFRLMQALRLP